jgi:hypothetical protein
VPQRAKHVLLTSYANAVLVLNLLTNFAHCMEDGKRFESYNHIGNIYTYFRTKPAPSCSLCTWASRMKKPEQNLHPAKCCRLLELVILTFSCIFVVGFLMCTVHDVTWCTLFGCYILWNIIYWHCLNCFCYWKNRELKWDLNIKSPIWSGTCYITEKN